jgi:hypothetical protein
MQDRHDLALPTGEIHVCVFGHRRRFGKRAKKFAMREDIRPSRPLSSAFSGADDDGLAVHQGRSGAVFPDERVLPEQPAGRGLERRDDAADADGEQRAVRPSRPSTRVNVSTREPITSGVA